MYYRCVQTANVRFVDINMFVFVQLNLSHNVKKCTFCLRWTHIWSCKKCCVLANFRREKMSWDTTFPTRIDVRPAERDVRKWAGTQHFLQDYMCVQRRQMYENEPGHNISYKIRCASSGDRCTKMSRYTAFPTRLDVRPAETDVRIETGHSISYKIRRASSGDRLAFASAHSSDSSPSAWKNFGHWLGGGRVWRRCRVSYVTEESNWYWFTAEQGLLSL